MFVEGRVVGVGRGFLVAAEALSKKLRFGICLAFRLWMTHRLVKANPWVSVGVFCRCERERKNVFLTIFWHSHFWHQNHFFIWNRHFQYKAATRKLSSSRWEWGFEWWIGSSWTAVQSTTCSFPFSRRSRKEISLRAGLLQRMCERIGGELRTKSGAPRAKTMESKTVWVRGVCCLHSSNLHGLSTVVWLGSDALMTLRPWLGNELWKNGWFGFVQVWPHGCFILVCG